MNLEFTVPGEPKPQARPRARVIQKAGRRPFATVYNAKGPDADYRARVAHEAHLAMEKHPPLSGPLSVNIAFVFAKPKGKPKYKHYHDVRPDTDNLMKACLDGMAKIVFRDDAQISLLQASKRYSPDGQSWTWVRVESLNERKK